MTVELKDLKWGSYSEWEGPYFLGSLKYVLPEDPTEEDRRLRVITATEGGSYDAVNMYDRCIVSVGLIQWCEARYYLTSMMLHDVAEALGREAVTGPLATALSWSCADFKKNSRGQWRFHFNDERGEVNTPEKQQQLFLMCSGKKGAWSEHAKAVARQWTVGMANIWQNPEARKVQVHYTAKRLMGFRTAKAKNSLWRSSDPTHDNGWVGMLRAAFLSFAANNPTWAGEQAEIAVKSLKSPAWSSGWCIGVLKQLTFGPNIAIYPHRYDKIRPWLEKLWDGIELPKTANELKAWTEPDVVLDTPAPEPSPPHVDEVVDREPEPEPVVPVVESQEEPEPQATPEEPNIVLREPAKVDLPRDHTTPQGVLGWILYVLQKIMEFVVKWRQGK